MGLPPKSGYNRTRVNALVFVTSKIGPEVLPYLMQNPDLNLRVISDSPKAEFQSYMSPGVSLDRGGVQEGFGTRERRK